MLFPFHVEALRCMMIERLWKESVRTGPLPELMSDIMAYTPKPTLTLDCPMEETLLDIKNEPAYLLVRKDVVYGIFKYSSSVMIEQLYPAGMRSEVVSKPSTSLPDYIYYYCPESAHLFLLSGYGFLIDFDIDAMKIHATFDILQLCSGKMSPRHMVILGDNLFVAVFGSSGAELRYARLSDPKRVIVAHFLPSVNEGSEILSLNPVSASPLEVSVWLNTRGDVYVSILRMIREDSPTLFAEMGLSSHPGTGTLPKTALVAGSGVHRIPGKDGGYCLRNNKGKLLFRSPDKSTPSVLAYRATSDGAGDIYFLSNKGECYRLLRASPYLR